MSGIIGADHQDDGFGISLSRQVAVVKSPKDVFGAVSGESEVQGIAMGVVLVPSGFSGTFESMSDGITDENEFVGFAAGEFVFLGVAFFPPFLLHLVAGDDS